MRLGGCGETGWVWLDWVGVVRLGGCGETGWVWLDWVGVVPYQTEHQQRGYDDSLKK